MLFLSVRGVLRLCRTDKSLAIDVVVVLPSSLPERSRHPVPNGLFEAQSPGPPIPLSTLQARPRDLACKTRGQDGFAALLSCRALSSPTTCRFIPALSGLPVIREGRWWHISSSLLESHSPMAGLRSAKSPHTYLL